MKSFSANARRFGSRYFLARGNNGYLMLEIMMAIAIFSVGFLAVGTLIVSTTRNNTTGNIITQATMLAAEKLQDLKDTSDIATLATGTYTDDHTIDDQGKEGGIYTRSWTVSDPLINPTSRRIQVRVSWNRLGQNRTVELTTITRGNGT